MLPISVFRRCMPFIHGLAVLFCFSSLPVLSANAVGRSDLLARSRLFDESTLQKNVRSFRREACCSPEAERFEKLVAWVLPSRLKPNFRLVGYFAPTDASPPTIEDPAYQAKLNALISPVFDLLDLAEQTAKLPLVEQAISKRLNAEEDSTHVDAAALLALVYLKQDKLDAATELIAKVQASVVLADDSRMNELWPATLLAYRCIHAHPNTSAGDDLALSLYTTHVLPNKTQAPRWWQSQIRDLVGRIRIRDWKSKKPIESKESTLANWVAMADSSDVTRAQGNPIAHWWRGPDGEVVKLGGHGADFLEAPFPLVGNYTIELDVRAGSTTQLMHRGEFIGLGHGPSSFGIGKLGETYQQQPIDPPMPKTKGWWRYRVSVKDNTEQVFLNGRLVRKRVLSDEIDPWFAVRGWYKSDAVIRDFRIAGSPTIPSRIRLDTLPNLSGWMAYDGEAVGGENAFWHQADHPGEERVLMTKPIALPSGSAVERLLRYHRPLNEDGRFEFEFFYEPESALTCPAIDRLALILTPTGVAEHWVTDGLHDVTRVRPDNRRRVPEHQRGDNKLPLKTGDWNHLAMDLLGNDLSVSLNGSLVYECPLNADMPRRLGLFCFADQHQIITRRIFMQGNWPQTLPEVQLAEDVRVNQLLRMSEQLPAKFPHDFSNDQQTNRFASRMNSKSMPEFTNRSDGIGIRVRSNGTWQQAGVSSALSMKGNFDVQLAFSELDVETPSKMGQVKLVVELEDALKQKLTASIGHDDWNHNAIRSGVATKRPGAGERFSNRVACDDSKCGRLRIVRQGDQFYSLFAQADSPLWRIIQQETVSTGNVDFGGIRVLVLANGAGQSSVVLKHMSIRADALRYQPGPDELPARVLSVFRVDGSNARDLTSPDDPIKMLASPAWSPDGKYIAFEQFPGDVVKSRIMIVTVDGGEPVDLGAGTVPDFSPDGTRIVFSDRREGLGIMDVDGANRKILSRGGWGLLFGPGESSLSYSSRRNVILGNLDLVNSRELLPASVVSQFSTVYWNLDWSPDGQRLAFNSQDRATGKNQLQIVDRSDPARVRTLYEGLPGGHVDHCWSPDGEQILIPLQRPGTRGARLFLVDPNGNQPPRPLPHAPSDQIIYGADWSPDCQWIAITALAEETSRPVPQ